MTVWRELAMAMALSAVAGLAAFAYGRYTYWRAWAPARFPAGLALFALANAAGGALTVALASWLDWEPRAGEWAYNAFVYALITQGLVRVEPKGRDLRTITHGRSILALAQRFVEQFLDHGCALALQRKLHALSDQQLFDQAMYLHGKYVASDAAVPAATRARQLKGLNDAAEQLTAGTQDGRGALESYCLNEVGARHLHPTMTWMPGLTPPA